MPHIAITMFPGRDDKTKEALAGKMKETLVKELGVSESVVSVSVQDVRKEDWMQRCRRFRKKPCLLKFNNGVIIIKLQVWIELEK